MSPWQIPLLERRWQDLRMGGRHTGTALPLSLSWSQLDIQETCKPGKKGPRDSWEGALHPVPLVTVSYLSSSCVHFLKTGPGQEGQKSDQSEISSSKRDWASKITALRKGSRRVFQHCSGRTVRVQVQVQVKKGIPDSQDGSDGILTAQEQWQPRLLWDCPQDFMSTLPVFVFLLSTTHKWNVLTASVSQCLMQFCLCASSVCWIWWGTRWLRTSPTTEGHSPSG